MVNIESKNITAWIIASHQLNLEKWKTRSMGLKLNKTIDKDNKKIANDETKIWRYISTAFMIFHDF